AGTKIARLVGAADDCVMVADSTSINWFKLLAAALRLRPERRVIVTSDEDFPTDLYMADGLAELTGDGVEVRRVPIDEVPDAIDESVAVVALGHVDFKTGDLRDLATLTQAAHARGATSLFDLAHSAGVVAIELDALGVDLAVGCGYKFLNGGPGAPAFAYVERRWHDALSTPLQGWLGHAAPFAFDGTYRPAPGVGRLQCGTPPILSLAALDRALDAYDDIDIADLRVKSQRLGSFFLERAAIRCPELTPISPLDETQRASQVSFRHAEGYAIVRAAIERGLVGDFRAPDVLRFGLAPLYLRYVDVWDAVEILREVIDAAPWTTPPPPPSGGVT
ncbi:MAG: aminotransferase class V-fold PLP-dependent enzyme, partial [Acidobacteriota bacterium]